LLRCMGKQLSAAKANIMDLSDDRGSVTNVKSFATKLFGLNNDSNKEAKDCVENLKSAITEVNRLASHVTSVSMAFFNGRTDDILAANKIAFEKILKESNDLKEDLQTFREDFVANMDSFNERLKLLNDQVDSNTNDIASISEKAEVRKEKERFKAEVQAKMCPTYDHKDEEIKKLISNEKTGSGWVIATQPNTGHTHILIPLTGTPSKKMFSKNEAIYVQAEVSFDSNENRVGTDEYKLGITKVLKLTIDPEIKTKNERRMTVERIKCLELTSSNIERITMYSPDKGKDIIPINDRQREVIGHRWDHVHSDYTRILQHWTMYRDENKHGVKISTASSGRNKKTKVVYRKGKCIINKDKKKKCAVGENDNNPEYRPHDAYLHRDKDLFCASIKLKKARVIQGKRTLRPMLCSPDSAALEYIIYSFANERSYRAYCEKCVQEKGADKCDTFNCIASVYGGFPGFMNPENKDTRKEKDKQCKREDFYDFSRRDSQLTDEDILTWGEGHD